MIFGKYIQYQAPGHVFLHGGFVKQLARSEHRAWRFWYQRGEQFAVLDEDFLNIKYIELKSLPRDLFPSGRCSQELETKLL